MKKYLTQRTVNIITLAGVGILGLCAFTTPSRPNNGFSSKKAHVEFDTQTNSNRFLDHELARLRTCGELLQRGISFHPEAPSSWLCNDVIVNFE